MITRYLVILKFILFKEPSFILKYYFHGSKNRNGSEYVFMSDGKIMHGGLFDRLKGTISIYALSKVHHKKFGIFFTNPFKLDNYLEPNILDWRINEEEMVYSYPFSRPVIAYQENKHPRRLLHQREGIAHYYFGGDILDDINQKYNTSFNWPTLFNELFKPSDNIQKAVERIKAEIRSNYIAIHLRFQNLLGDEVERRGRFVLNDEEKKWLIDLCINKIGVINSNLQSNVKTIVFSDSTIFLGVVKDKLHDVFVVPGSVKHIDTVSNTTDDENLKLFVDMYLMVGAEKIISIIGKGLYPSAFPEYSSKIGNNTFERISLS